MTDNIIETKLKIETTKQYTYIMQNGDKYIISQTNDSKWVLHMYDNDNINGKFIAKHKFISEIYERIPN